MKIGIRKDKTNIKFDPDKGIFHCPLFEFYPHLLNSIDFQNPDDSWKNTHMMDFLLFGIVRGYLESKGLEKKPNVINCTVLDLVNARLIKPDPKWYHDTILRKVRQARIDGFLLSALGTVSVAPQHQFNEHSPRYYTHNK